MQGCPTAAAAAVARVLAMGGPGVVGERGIVWRKQGWKWDICTRVVDKSSVPLSLSILTIFSLFPPSPFYKHDVSDAPTRVGQTYFSGVRQRMRKTRDPFIDYVCLCVYVCVYVGVCCVLSLVKYM